MNLTEQEIRMAIKNFRETGSNREFNKLFDYFTPIMEGIISRYNYDKNELFSEACDRFLSAIKNFDISGTTKFSTYLHSIINNYTKNYLRRHAALFGRRSGNGESNASIFGGADLEESFLEDSGSHFGYMPERSNDLEGNIIATIIGTMVGTCAAEVLDDEELEVVQRFYGIGEHDEPTYSEKKAKREDALEFSRKDKVWVNNVVPESTKIARIAREMKKPRTIVATIYQRALDKLRTSDLFMGTCKNYMTNSNTQFVTL